MSERKIVRSIKKISALGGGTQVHMVGDNFHLNGRNPIFEGQMWGGQTSDGRITPSPIPLPLQKTLNLGMVLLLLVCLPFFVPGMFLPSQN